VVHSFTKQCGVDEPYQFDQLHYFEHDDDNGDQQLGAKRADKSTSRNNHFDVSSTFIHDDDDEHDIESASTTTAANRTASPHSLKQPFDFAQSVHDELNGQLRVAEH